jgi:hypothetical protein
MYNNSYRVYIPTYGGYHHGYTRSQPQLQVPILGPTKEGWCDVLQSLATASLALNEVQEPREVRFSVGCRGQIIPVVYLYKYRYK